MFSKQQEETHVGSDFKNHQVVSHEEWLAARIALLAKEKEFTQQREELARQRRALPWEKVEKQYVFDGPNGKETLPDLFGKHSQLVVYHVSFTSEEAHNRTAFYNYVKTDPGPLDREGVSAFYKDESGAVFHTYSY